MNRNKMFFVKFNLKNIIKYSLQSMRNVDRQLTLANVSKLAKMYKSYIFN